MIADMQIERDDKRLLKFEVGFLACLILVTIFLTQALIHNYSGVQPVFVLHPVANLIPATTLKSVQKSSPELLVTNQSTHIFQPDTWVTDDQVFVANSKQGEFLEWELAGLTPGRKNLQLYLTKSNDYGIVQLSVNGKTVGDAVDLYDRTVRSKPAVDFGVVTVKDHETSMKLRLTVVGKNPSATAPFYQFGVQGFLLAPVTQ